MSPNTFGNRFCVTTFGESHGVGLGCVIDGCPAGVSFDPSILKANLDRRRPGSSDLVTARKEDEIPEILSGIFNGKTLGTPIAIIVKNTDQRPDDYARIKSSPRTGHADDVWKIKFGLSDHRGGGRSSGRETLSRVLAGSLAQMLMHKVAPETKVFGWIESIGPCFSDQKVIDSLLKSKSKLKAAATENFRFFGSQKIEVLNLLKSAKESGESYGAVLKMVILNPPKSLGEPVFRKFKSDLAMAMMSVGAASGFDFGAGIESVDLPGTLFHQAGPRKSKTKSSQEQYGGIRGGITTGEDITFRIFVKPTSSILDTAKKGRHDPCIGIRALAVFEAMTYLVLADQYLMMKTNRA